MPDDEEEQPFWAVMYNKDGHISMTPSDGSSTPEGTIMYNHWTVVATDLSKKDAAAYVNMNWKEMTPYSVAKTLRDTKFKKYSDEEFEALYHRQSLKEFHATKDAYFAEEAKAA